MIRRAILTLRFTRILWRALSARKNRRKGGWGHMSPQLLLLLAQGEMQELSAAMWKHADGEETVEAVLSEAGDVAAYLAMLCENVRRLR